MSNYTPGPWEAVWNDDEGRIEIHMASALKCSRYCMASHVWMCEATVYSDEDTAHAREIEATARLIAAAPQLLEALEEAEKDLVACRINIRRDLVQRGNTMWEGVPEILDARIKHIRAAIAAARGEGK